MVNYWFTSDWHIGHKNILEYSNRPFKNIEEMNWSIIDQHNAIVDSNDHVYFLGDFAMSKNIFLKHIDNVKGQIFFILGNHDYNYKKFILDKVHEVSDIKIIKINNQYITLCHYPMYTHYMSHYNMWQLYGHEHRDVSDWVKGKKMNVGVDVNNYKTISFEQVQEYMDKRENNDDIKEKRNNEI